MAQRKSKKKTTQPANSAHSTAASQNATPKLSIPHAKECWYPSEAEDLAVRWGIGPDDAYHSGEAAIQFENALAMPARVLRTTCNQRKLAAASIRLSGGDKSPKHSVAPPIAAFDLRLLPPSVRSESKFAVSPDAVGDQINAYLGLYQLPQGRDAATLSIKGDLETHADEKVASHPSGLIVVAGGTGTGKSVYAKSILLRWLIRSARERYQALEIMAHESHEKLGRSIEEVEQKFSKVGEPLRGRVGSEFRERIRELQEEQSKILDQHLAEYVPLNLVTLEDPIEGWTAFDFNSHSTIDLCDADDSESDIKHGIRLTARALVAGTENGDVESGDAAFRDALRQKPAAFYIGECRSSDEWERAIDLGATGHLVITTCHASSLVDTFAKLAGDDKRDAQSRRHLAKSLLGVIHLCQSDINNNPSSFPLLTSLKRQQTFFHLWRNTPESVSNFVVDGLSSLVSDGDNVISRTKLIREVISLQSSSIHSYDIAPKDSGFYNALSDALESAASQLDQEGL